MEQSEIKLIHFDSAYFLPASIPLIHIDPSDKSHSPCASDFISETNRDELTRAVKCVPSKCSLCDCFFVDIKEVIHHVFSLAHIEMVLKVRGSISKRDFAFWARLFKIFPNKEGEGASEELRQQQLADMSTTLDLHSRLQHFRVEVSSADDHIASVSQFIQLCVSRCKRVVVYCKDCTERDTITQLIPNPGTSKVTSNPFAWTERGSMWKVSLDVVSNCSPFECAIFLRPPMENQSILSAFYAFQICSSHVESSLMLINGKKEKEALQKFEKKFMNGNTDPLPIYDKTVLRLLEEMARTEEKKKSTVDQSISDPSVESLTYRPQKTAFRRLKSTVSPSRIDSPSEPTAAPLLITEEPTTVLPSSVLSVVDPPIIRVKTTMIASGSQVTDSSSVSSTTVPDAGGSIIAPSVKSVIDSSSRPQKTAIRRLKPTTSPAPIDPPSESTVSPESVTQELVEPTVSTACVLSVANPPNITTTAVSEKHDTGSAFTTVPSTTVTPTTIPSTTVPSTTVSSTTVSSTTVSSTTVSSTTVSSTTVSSTTVSSVEEVKMTMGDLLHRISEVLQRVRRNPCVYSVEIVSEIEELLNSHEDIVEVLKSELEERERDERRLSTSVDTLHGLKKTIDGMRDDVKDIKNARELQQVTTVSRSTVGDTRPKTVKVVPSVRDYSVDVVRREEGEREKRSRRAARRKKEWKEIFTPFDEQTTMSVEELITMLNESTWCV